MNKHVVAIVDRRERKGKAHTGKRKRPSQDASAYDYLARYANGTTKWRTYKQLKSSVAMIEAFNKEQEKLDILQFNQHLSRTGSSPRSVPQSPTSVALQRLRGHQINEPPAKRSKNDEVEDLPISFRGILQREEDSGAAPKEQLPMADGQSSMIGSPAPAEVPAVPFSNFEQDSKKKGKSIQNEATRRAFLLAFSWLDNCEREADGEFRVTCTLCDSRVRFDSATIKRHAMCAKHKKFAIAASLPWDVSSTLKELMRSASKLGSSSFKTPSGSFTEDSQMADDLPPPDHDADSLPSTQEAVVDDNASRKAMSRHGRKKSRSANNLPTPLIRRTSTMGDLLTDHQREIREQQKNQDHVGVFLYNDLDQEDADTLPKRTSSGDLRKYQRGRPRRSSSIGSLGSQDSQDDTMLLDQNFTIELEDDSISCYPKFDISKSNSRVPFPRMEEISRTRSGVQAKSACPDSPFEGDGFMASLRALNESAGAAARRLSHADKVSSLLFLNQLTQTITSSLASSS